MTDPIEIKEAIKATTEEFKALLDKQAEEIRATGETSKETVKRLGELETSLKSAAEADAERMEKMRERMDELEAKSKRIGQAPQDRKSIGRQFVESEAFEQVKANGYRGESRPVEIKAATNGAISDHADSAGGLLTPFLRDQILGDPEQPVFVRELLPNIPVNTDAVQIFREVGFDNEAAPQAEPGSHDGKTKYLAAKAQSDLQFDNDTITIETLAHYVIASRQILSDVPRLEAYINQRLVYGLNLKLDQEILYGNGSSQNLNGIMTDAAVWDIAGPVGTAIDHVRHGITVLQLANYYNVTGLVMGPEDWEAIETAKGGDQRYLWVTVPDGGVPRLWRVPVVVSNSMSAGDFLMGDFTMGAALYTREGMTVRTSESHADLFVRNGVAILAEVRAGLGVELPHAFVKGNFNDGPVTTA